MQPGKRASEPADASFREEANVLLPEQFWGPRTDPRPDPEKRLMAAVLEEAILLIQNHSDSRSVQRRKLVAEACAWIASDERSGPFCFATICDVFGLDVERVRAAVNDLRLGRCCYSAARRLQAGRGRHRVQSGSRRAA
jgi:hypothetical protein